jgi:hypothetical protein
LAERVNQAFKRHDFALARKLCEAVPVADRTAFETARKAIFEEERAANPPAYFR